MPIATARLPRSALVLGLLTVFGCPAEDPGPPEPTDDPTPDDDDDDDSTPIDGPPSAPVVFVPPSTSVGVATSVTITAGVDPEGGQINVQCASSGSNFPSATPFASGLGAGGRTLSTSFTWSAAGYHDLFCTSFDAGGQPSLLVQDTISVADPTLFKLPMVLLPAGTFTMGCLAGRDDISSSCDSDESPSHSVTLTHSFWVAQTETTQAQFEALMGYNLSYFGANGSGTDCGTNCPVEQVSWHEAAAFANALSFAGGLSACYACSGSAPWFSCTPLGDPYQCAGYRLPTEAEWEYAARGAEAWECAGSASLGDVGWYSSNSGSTLHPSGQLLPNGFGLFDLSGNVWEWTEDWYSSSYYASSPTVDPAGPASGSLRVQRGGSWADSANSARAANRFDYWPDFSSLLQGFRLCRSIP